MSERPAIDPVLARWGPDVRFVWCDTARSDPVPIAGPSADGSKAALLAIHASQPPDARLLARGRRSSLTLEEFVVRKLAGGVLVTLAVAVLFVTRPRRGWTILGRPSTSSPRASSGGLPANQYSTDQGQLYNALTPLRGNVTTADVSRDYLSEKFGVQGPGRPPSSAPGAGPDDLSATATTSRTSTGARAPT